MRTIETARLRLRPFTMNDLGALHQQIYSDAEVMRYLPGGQPRSMDQTEVVLREFVAHKNRHGYTIDAVTDKRSGQLIGMCGLFMLKEDGAVEIAYALGQPFWGQGYTTEAALAVLRCGFESVGLGKIIALAVPENIASQRVMQKIGMQHQGLTRRYYDADLVLYTLASESFSPDDSLYRMMDTHESTND
jgi:ribosomal-protein-alanine N-acetyltransferase